MNDLIPINQVTEQPTDELQCCTQQTDSSRTKPQPNKPGILTAALTYVFIVAMMVSMAAVYVLGALQLGEIIVSRF